MCVLTYWSLKTEKGQGVGASKESPVKCRRQARAKQKKPHLRRQQFVQQINSFPVNQILVSNMSGRAQCECRQFLATRRLGGFGGFRFPQQGEMRFAAVLTLNRKELCPLVRADYLQQTMAMGSTRNANALYILGGQVAAATVRGVADPSRCTGPELPQLPAALPKPSTCCPPALLGSRDVYPACGNNGLVAFGTRRRFFAPRALPPGSRSSGRRSALYPPSQALLDVDSADTPVSFATLIKYF